MNRKIDGRLCRSGSGEKARSVLAVALPLVMGAGNVAGKLFANVLDSYLGPGQLRIDRAPGTHGWDARYYQPVTDSLQTAKAASDHVSQEMANEGIVLLKNKDLLPLQEGTCITPFGRAYLDPAYAGTGAAATADRDRVTPALALAMHLAFDVIA